MFKKLFRGFKLKRIEKKVSFHQHLMNEAYRYWNEKNTEWSYQDFIENLPDVLSNLHSDAVIIGNLNYQVSNGGWLQWYLNGYHTTHQSVYDILDRFSDFSKTSKNIVSKVRNILEDVMLDIEMYDALDTAADISDYNKIKDILSEEGQLDYNSDYVREKTEDILSEYNYTETSITEDLADEIVDKISCKFHVKEVSDIKYMLVEGDPIDYITETVYEIILWENNKRVLDNIRRNLSTSLSSSYYEYNDEFMEEFNEWLKDRYLNGRN